MLRRVLTPILSSLLSSILGAPPAGNLPARIGDIIARQQRHSEILIGWVQFALVTVFAALWWFSPKMGDLGFQPVPWALSVYAAVTVLRLVAAYRSRLPDWAVMASIVLDMALLMGLIWSFHIQYHQPAAFYLKAPTLLYVFIFIALRALRFEAKYVIASGVAAAAGWTILLWYAAMGEFRIANLMTRDYVAYITSNRILVGAEVDKIVSILLVTAVLAVAVARGRRILYRAVADSVAARDLSRFVSPEVAERIATAERPIQAGDGELRTATVLFTDIEGFSTISEKLSPQQLAAMLNDYFTALGEIISRHGGTILMFQGDALLVGFNVVSNDPDHAASALKAGLAIRDISAARTFGPGCTLKTRGGVNTGPITVGAVGSGNRLVFTVHGDEVNIAARLEQLNKNYGTYLLASRQTCDAAGEGFRYREI
ncbi:MAG: adenylate/guanylate cyclase domain-containing protein, partial [Alphaproteobacteria bacterium]|nr:adenylate/guanylate cyclase domain-containing protein [Alphaproteobacteria bacterium]